MGYFIIIFTALTSVLAFRSNAYIDKYSFNPYRISKFGEYYRFVSYGFVHASYSHLIFNMLTLYFVIDYVQEIFSPFFIVFYLLALVVSVLPDYFKYRNYPYYTGIGRAERCRRASLR